MSDFLVSILKGLYPPFLFFLVWGAAVRIRARRWSRFDTLLTGAFLVFAFLASFQVRLFYGIFQTSRRYLWIGIPLYLPLAACGIADLRDRLKKSRAGRIAFGLLLAALAVWAAVSFYTPVLRDYLPGKKRDRRLATLAAAEWIRWDWKTRAGTSAVTEMKCDRYQSGRRPLVKSDLIRTGYLCGGQNYPEFLRGRRIPPDYIVSAVPIREKGYLPPVHLTAGPGFVYISRREGTRP